MDVSFFIEFESEQAFYEALETMYPEDNRDIFVLTDKDVFVNGTAVHFYVK